LPACPREQALGADQAIEAIVGLDAEATPPAHLVGAAMAPRFIMAPAGATGQSAALNAAAAAATGDFIAFLEDDDWWEREHLVRSIHALADFEFVSSSQRLVDSAGRDIGVFGYPTPSGWVMPRRLFGRVGPFNEDFRFHLDGEWLGRLNRVVTRRAHFVENAPGSAEEFLAARQDLASLLAYARPADVSLLRGGGDFTQAVRTQNPDGGVSRIRRDAAIKQRSRHERALLRQLFGHNPW
jgi:glycosyltransferase involved in cell wall biosynthesis